MPAIQSVSKQALKTFGANTFNASFEDNFAKLKSLVDSISAVDVNLDCRLLEGPISCPSSRHMKKPPISYIKVFENDILSIGIFVLRPGAKIPLHDHPRMHGVLKVLKGTLKLQSYNLLPAEGGASKETRGARKRAVLAEKLPAVLVNERDASCVLTPDQGNLHEIIPVNGPAAFIDLLAPPYETTVPNSGERSCHYFKETKLHDSRRQSTPNMVALVSIPCPREFGSEYAPYTGPVLE
ncbi:hypothetical protein R5R35_007849 [Gryllus longicercus]|uniref:2-aminoethanethiol dioxygenase n=1 Tax=Gryllus longicercus TaxID=2509291 RepID=A0AAN9V2S2_9ORTH